MSDNDKQTSFKNIISSSSNLRRNISSFSSNSLSFRFWNKKDDTDNFSDISMDNDMHHEFNTNIDSISLNNRINSNENIVHRSVSPNVKQSKFQYELTNGINQSKSNFSPTCSPNSSNKNQDNFNFPSATNGVNYHKSFFLKKLPVEPMNELSNSSISTTISSSLSSRLSPGFQKKTFDISHDDEQMNPNMDNYNYYSNMITNLKTTNEPVDTDDNKTSPNLIISLSSTKTVSNSNKFPKIELCNSQKGSQESTKSDSVLKKLNSNSSGSSDTMKNATRSYSSTHACEDRIANTEGHKRLINSKKKLTGITSITNGILNNSLSASASSLEQDHLQKPMHRKNGYKESNKTHGSTGKLNP